MKMNINILLEKYWNAETSLQEEAELRSYFSNNDVAPEHIQYKEMFTYFSESRMQTTNLDVENVLASINDIDTILEKYWNAETTLEEEAVLKAYFAGTSISENHAQYKDLFIFYQVSQNQTSELSLNALFDKSESIDDLLEKYWNAEASLEDEQVLKDYFSGSQVAERHESLKDMFHGFKLQGEMTTDLDIEQVIKDQESKGNRAIGSPAMPKASKARVFSLQKWAAGLAAVFVMAFAAVTVMTQEVEPQYKGEFTVLDDESEAQEAYEITKEALAFLSKNMNKGSKTVVESVSKAEKASIFK